MKEITTLAELTALGRVRLSEHFFMREMLYSEVGNFYGVANYPEDADLAVQVGTKLCQNLLEPLRAALGHVSIRSAYRSPTLNAYCHRLHEQGVAEAWCVSNEENAAYHIWDRRDQRAHAGATATIVIPAYIAHHEKTREWRPLGWWIRDHLEHYAQVSFFRNLCAFNIRWYEGQTDQSIAYLDPPQRETLTRRGDVSFEGDHRRYYDHVPVLARASTAARR